MDMSPRLLLPYILPSQAQKHITHNEALDRLDCLVQLTIENEAQVPPSNPEEGTCYAVASGATGAWSGFDAMIAVWRDGGWRFIEIAAGHHAWFRLEAVFKVFDGLSWIRPALPRAIVADGIGVGATPDDYNRISVSSPAMLLNHAGTSHRLTINKAASADTASILFQSNWSGRAEMGLAGSDAFSFKVSPDGGAWNTALLIRHDGAITQPQRPLAAVSNSAGSTVVASGTISGFSNLTLTQGSVTLGNALSGGGQAVSVPIEGLYLLSLKVAVSAATNYTVMLKRETGETLMALRFPSSVPITLAGTTIAQFSANEKLALAHQGTATLTQGPGETELMLARV